MKKQIISLLIISIILFTKAFEIGLVSASSNRIIRVKISVSGKTIKINVDGEYTVKEDPSLMIPRGPYTITIADTNKVQINGAGVNRIIGTSITLVRNKYQGEGNNHLNIEGTVHGNINYLGDFVFTVSGANLLVVNHVPLEQYLYGVVAYEMSNSFPVEALKAQAVSARGYAIKAISSSGTYDIGDTASDQVYKGYNPAYKNVLTAVDSTAGEVLTYNDSIISTYYSASNGGQTEVPGNAWGGGDVKNKSYPYLAQRDDPYDLENSSSLYQKIFVPQQVEGSQYEAASIPGDFVARIINVNEFCNVRSGPGTNFPIVGEATINSVYQWLGVEGNWNKVEYNGATAYISTLYSEKVTNGRFLYANSVLSDIQTRAYNKLKSEGINITLPTDVMVVTVDSLANGTERWPGSGSRTYVTAGAKVKVKYYQNELTDLSEERQLDLVLDLMKKSGSSYVLAHDYLDSRLSMRGVLQADEEGGYYITNARFGHGVGMSQRGAQMMASSKYRMTYKQILAFYFKDTLIKKLDTTVPELPDPKPSVPEVPETEAPESELPEQDVNPVITSDKYQIGTDTITKLSSKLSVEQFIPNLSITNGSVGLLSAEGEEKTSGVLATGDVIQLRSTAGAVYKEYSIVIYGDVNGDGSINLVDMLHIHKHLLGVSKLEGVYSTAGDVSRDNNISLVDLLKVHRQLLRIEEITQ